MEFHDHIWNHHEKYIEISTNIPVIGSLIREIAIKISKNIVKKVNILEFHDHIWNHNEKYIQISFPLFVFPNETYHNGR